MSRPNTKILLVLVVVYLNNTSLKIVNSLGGHSLDNPCTHSAHTQSHKQYILTTSMVEN